MKVFCPYCTKRAEYVDSAEVYPRSYGMMYLCRDCNAYVSVHAGTDKPKGTLAKAPLRELRKKVHGAFDPLWQQGGMNRKAAYGWLAKCLNIKTSQCHIALFDEARCKEALRFLDKPF